MRIYLWFITGMLIFLFLFILITLIIKAPKINLLFKILRILSLAVILVLIYIMLTRVLGVFHYDDSEWRLDLSFLKPVLKQEEPEEKAVLFISNIFS